MFLSVRDKSTMRLAFRAKVINKDTKEEIPRVIWANEETGRYRQILADGKGKFLINKERTAVISKIFKGNIEIRIGEAS